MNTATRFYTINKEHSSSTRRGGMMKQHQLLSIPSLYSLINSARLRPTQPGHSSSEELDSLLKLTYCWRPLSLFRRLGGLPAPVAFSPGSRLIRCRFDEDTLESVQSEREGNRFAMVRWLGGKGCENADDLCQPTTLVTLCPPTVNRSLGVKLKNALPATRAHERPQVLFQKYYTHAIVCTARGKGEERYVSLSRTCIK